MTIELATSARDGWELRSGEQSRRDHPDTLIPPVEVRHGLQRGDLVRLVVERADGGVPPVVAERIDTQETSDKLIALMFGEPPTRRWPYR